MTGRIPLDDLTSDALDALYERLDVQEQAIQDAMRLASLWAAQGTLGNAPHLLRRALAPALRPKDVTR
ncbi:hypothetical protein H114_00787 [Streptomyces gancidicus BKS 13-15]|uniref:Uncharacterized protein n=1 Tax=Streptomyces gancidicus BKS 13-15 TaxID=1284664 RepID=M3DMA8_STREZ|nr:hypothetical protein [Streptomyces gancidicus]EMF31120.1 hypothetical protein H114_00787 [Streptomyces gancidicus BKS 13-15]